MWLFSEALHISRGGTTFAFQIQKTSMSNEIKNQHEPHSSAANPNNSANAGNTNKDENAVYVANNHLQPSEEPNTDEHTNYGDTSLYKGLESQAQDIESGK